MGTIQISVRSAYGRDRYYPENVTARDLALFADIVTFTKSQLEVLKRLGYRIETVAPTAPTIDGVTD